jgi:hypothetical protein
VVGQDGHPHFETLAEIASAPTQHHQQFNAILSSLSQAPSLAIHSLTFSNELFTKLAHASSGRIQTPPCGRQRPTLEGRHSIEKYPSGAFYTHTEKAWKLATTSWRVGAPPLLPFDDNSPTPPQVATAIMTTLRSLETVPGGSTTPTMSSKPLPTSSVQSQKPVKSTTPIAPRIDVEPIYSALKAAVGRNWNLYRETVGLYLLGMSPHASLEPTGPISSSS